MKLIDTKALKRLKRNRSALFGIALILISVFLSVFAYTIIPDKTPDANEQILQLETHNPGFSIEVLKVKKNQPVKSASWLDFIVNGKENDSRIIPILNYKIVDDRIFFTEYKGARFPPQEGVLMLSDVCHSVRDTAADVKRSGNSLIITTTDGKVIETNINELLITTKERIGRITYHLGSDKFGRDILSRLVLGVRVSLSVGLISVIISLVIGVLLGAMAGYFRGWVDESIMWCVNLFWSIPTLLLAMGLYISAGAWFSSKLVLIFVAVGLTMWVEVARIVRGQFIAVAELEFVAAAKSLGYGHARIIVRHILPNIIGPVIVVACANFANAILVESGLSYIGLGIQPPAPSWGSMLNEYKDFIDSSKAYLAIFPGLCIMLLVLAFNLLGNGLRDALDVRGNSG